MIINGWRIYFITRLFGQQRQDLQAKVRRLKKTLPPGEYRTHATVKLYTAIMVAIKEKIPPDPKATHFSLTGALKRYGRVKNMGLPDRYRLFFRVLETKKQRAIFVLWLGYPRKEGDKNDCYEVFTKMVMRGEFPDDLDALIRGSEQE